MTYGIQRKLVWNLERGRNTHYEEKLEKNLRKIREKLEKIRENQRKLEKFREIQRNLEKISLES